MGLFNRKGDDGPSPPSTKYEDKHASEFNVATQGIEEMVDPTTRLHRGLKARQVTMIAIGGAIGTGLVIGTGSALANAGPGSIFISYSVVGFIVWIVMCCLGEMAAWLPLESGFTGSVSFPYPHPFMFCNTTPILLERRGMANYGLGTLNGSAILLWALRWATRTGLNTSLLPPTSLPPLHLSYNTGFLEKKSIRGSL